MLRFHFLNVGHGDSTVLEFIDGDTRSFGVVDSFRASGGHIPALELLKEKGAERIAFLALTHPHADHFFGLGSISDAFQGRVGTYFTFPVYRTPERLRSLAALYCRESANLTVDLVASNEEFVRFIAGAKDSGSWEECAVSSKNQLHVPSMPGVSISAILPPAKVKGEYLDQWMTGVIGGSAGKLNELSIALLIEFAGRQVVICGDATHTNIAFMKPRWGKALDPIAVKLPHHGSHIDCPPEVLDTLFPQETEIEGDRYAFISANGKSHPASEVLSGLVARHIKPYCTNLATRCGGPARQHTRVRDPVTPELRSTLSVLANEPARVRSCQGNMSLTIFPDGTYAVDREFENLCPLRAELSHLPPFLA